MEEEKNEALENVKGQLKNGYIDITDTYPDHAEFNIVKAAVEQFEKNKDIEQKIRDKIKELEKELKNFDNNFGDCVRNQEYITELEIKIQVLKQSIGE